MKKVFKYTIIPNDLFSVELPEGAKILKIDTQYTQPQLWALVDPDAPKCTRNFRMAGTGHPIEISSEYSLDFIDTFKMNGGQFVFHIFEITEKQF